jgi:hypothetical protein
MDVIAHISKFVKRNVGDVTLLYSQRGFKYQQLQKISIEINEKTRNIRKMQCM